MDTQWIPLMDYSMKTGVSLSTLRRHIKAGKIEFRRHEGRYLLKDESPGQASVRSASPSSFSTTRPETIFSRVSSDSRPSVADSRNVDDLNAIRLQLRHAQEEIAELKTLLACYEERES
jgi:predicted site-specific integrase-resolvase